jgi:tetratricopeptide (TPR) repeat protein
VLYWFFTGASPFASSNPDRDAKHAEELKAVRTCDPKPLSAKNPMVPPELAALVQQLLSKNPADRPESARAALARIEALTARLNAPREAEAVIGRGDLLAAAGKALAAGGVVGLSGGGGMGKTFVAQALVRAHRTAGGTDVWIDCAAAPRFEGVVRETAAQLFAERCDTEPLEALAPRVAAQAVARAGLLVLDNFEQTGGDSDLSAWLRKFRAPARALVVGRSIPVDLPDVLLPVTELDPASAAELFRTRAKAAGLADDLPGDVLDRLCAAVGYHPLALELLAKRACRVPLQALLDSVLVGLMPAGGTGRGGWSASIRACFAESLKSLSPAAREHLLALSVLPAPFSPKMMAVVVGFDDGCAAAEELVGASLWRAGGTRYAVHPLVRRVAREELGERRGEYELRAAARVATHMRAVREELRGSADAAVTKMYMGRCEVELPNLLALAATGPGPEVELAEALSAFWGARGHWDAAERLYTSAAEAARTLNDPVREAWCREFRSYILRRLGRHDESDRMYRAALDLCARHPAARAKHFGRIVTRYGKLCAVRGKYDDVVAHLTAGLDWFRAAGDHEGVLNALTNLGQARRFKGDLARAEELYTEALRCERKSAHGEGEVRLQLGKTYLQQGRYAEATAQLGLSLRIARAAGDGVRESLVLIDLGVAAERAGDWPEAERLLTSGLQIAREMGLRMFEGRALRRTAEFFLARKAPGDAALAREYARAALAILADSEDAWAADRARETLREAEAAS